MTVKRMDNVGIIRGPEGILIGLAQERGRQDSNSVLVHFRRSSPAVRRGVARRFRDEQRDALGMLAEETGG